MKVEISTKRLEHVAADALVVGLYVGETKLPERLARLDRAAQGQLKRVLDAEKFQAKVGQVTHVHADGRRIVVAGLGPRAEMAPGLSTPATGISRISRTRSPQAVAFARRAETSATSRRGL